MSVLRDRFLYGTLLLGGALGLLFLDHKLGNTYGFLGLGLLFGVVSWIEFSRMSKLERGGVLGALLIAGGLIADWVVDGRVSGGGIPLWPAAMLLPPVLFLGVHLKDSPARERLVSVALATFGVSFILIPLLLFLRLRSLDHGEVWVLLTVLVVKGNDIGAYLTGRKIGKTPLTAISPKKTVEGSAGGLLLGVLVAGLFAWQCEWLSYGLALTCAVVAGVAGQIGDLAESYMKRSFEVKDSGALVPAFGGSFDMLDSLLFGAPVVYLFARFS